LGVHLKQERRLPKIVKEKKFKQKQKGNMLASVQRNRTGDL